jgi:hypothetical protein
MIEPRHLRGDLLRFYRSVISLLKDAAEAIRAADPHHLLIGSRMHLGDKYPEVIAACAPYIDVTSLNHYRHCPDVPMLERIYAIAQKPLFIGE